MGITNHISGTKKEVSIQKSANLTSIANIKRNIDGIKQKIENSV